MKFVCPSCGNSTGIEEVLIGAVCYSDVQEIQRIPAGKRLEVDYGDIRVAGKRWELETHSFKCKGCDYVITEENGEVVEDIEDLYTWLNNRSMI